MASLKAYGVAVSPFMAYWSLKELLRYYEKHLGTILNVV